jgi:hypothetical protein
MSNGLGHVLSLLIIRVPRRSLISQKNIDLDEVIFQWSFIADIKLNPPVDQEKMIGIGPMASMPKADQVIIFMSTLDVRLMPMKIPLVSDKKIQMIMPGLLEDHLLDDVAKFDFKILNPSEGDPALDRTVAVVDKHWMHWVISKVHQLGAHRVRLLPDCYLLRPDKPGQSPDNVMEQSPPSVAYEVMNNQVIWTVRLGEQTGASWIDQINDVNQINHLADHDRLVTMLPSQLRGKPIASFDWSSDWAMNSALHLAQLPDHDGTNLLPDSYQVPNLAKSDTQIQDQVFKFFVQWFTQWSWSSNKSMFILAPLSFFAGYVIYGAAIFLMNLGFNYQMNTLVSGYLKESSRASVASSGWDFQQISDINQFLSQYHLEKKRAGEVSQADFQMMSSDLKQLIKMYGDGGIKRMTYKGSSIEFEFMDDYLNTRKITSEKVVSDAATLDMLVISLGEDRFKLLPYAGLGHGL